MTIDTQYLDADGDKIKLARPALLDMAQRANRLSAESVTTVANLRGVDKTKASRCIVLGRNAAGDGGGGIYYYDSADTTSADNGGSIIVATDGARWKLVQNHPVSVRQFGATGDGTTDDTAAIQAAMDVAKNIYFPAGTYKITAPLEFKSDGIKLVGAGRKLTIISYTGTVSAFRNNAATTTTRLFCSIEHMQVSASSINTGYVIDWKSMQFGQLRNVWVVGQSVLGCRAINMEAVWTVTECTYNIVEGCYIGLCAIGIAIGDGANSNWINGNRFQVSVSGGIGIQLSGSAADRVSNISIIANGFEYPGAINTGVNVLQNCDGVVILGNRFELLATGIVVGATGNKNVTAPFSRNYFSSCTTNINNSTGGSAHQFDLRAAAATTTAGGVVSISETAHNLTVTRTGTGAYTFTFVNALPNTGYSVSANSSQKFTIVTSKSAASFTVATQDGSQVAADAPILDVAVFYNR